MKKKTYETIMCVIAAVVFLVLPCKLVLALTANYWNELLWVQILQLCGVGALLVMILYSASIFQKNPGEFSDKCKKIWKNQKWMLCFFGFILCMFISFFLNERYQSYQAMADALYGSARRNEGIIFRCLEIVIMIGFVFVTDKKKKRNVYHILLVASLCLSIPVLAQEYDILADLLGLSQNKAFLYMAKEGKGASVLNYFNHYGYYLSLAILLAAGLFIAEKNRKRNVFYAICYIVNIFTLTVNNTFGSWLCAAVAMLLISVLWILRAIHLEERKNSKKHIKKMGIILAGFFLISAVREPKGDGMYAQTITFFQDIGKVATDSDSPEAMGAGTGRWSLWKTCGQFIAQKPLFGWCEDGIASLYHEEGYIQDRPANEYLQYAAFYGILGAGCYVLALILICVDRIKNLYKLPPEVLIAGGAVLAYALSACFGNTTNFVTMHFFVLLGMTAER